MLLDRSPMCSKMIFWVDSTHILEEILFRENGTGGPYQRIRARRGTKTAWKKKIVIGAFTLVTNVYKNDFFGRLDPYILRVISERMGTGPVPRKFAR